MDKVAKLEQDKELAKVTARKEKLAAVAGADQADALAASLEGVSDEAFATILSAFDAKAKALEESELFIEKGANSEEAADRQEQKIDTMAVLKAKYAKQ
jgi:aspartokinase